MSGIATFAEVSVDQIPGPIAMAVAAAISVSLVLHWIFDVAPTASGPASAHIQRRQASTTVDRFATNQTLSAHSVLPFTLTDLGGHNLPTASAGKSTMLVISAALHRRWPR